MTAEEIKDLIKTLEMGQRAMELAEAHIKILEHRIIELERAVQAALEAAHAH